MQRVKKVAIILLIVPVLLFSGCNYVTFSVPGNWSDSVSVRDLLKAIYVTEDEEIWQYQGDFSSYWQKDDSGEYIIVRSSTGYMKIYKNGEDYSFYAYVDGIETSGDFETCISQIEPDWRDLCSAYDEKVLSLDELKTCFSEVELTAENYADYIGFEKLETEKEFTGYSSASKQRVKPYIYMYNTYVGPGTLLTDYSSKISLSGTVSRNVTINIYSLSNSLSDSYTDTDESGDDISFDISYSPVYIGDESLYSIHFTPYMDPLESWYLKTYSNGTQEVHQTLIDISNIEITEASGTLEIFEGLSEDMISTDTEGNSYVAVKLADGTLSRISLESEDYNSSLAALVLEE